MSEWYYSKNGKAQGPVEENEIGTAIKTGTINELDLVFEVGGEEWKPVAQVDAFGQFFKIEEPEVVSTQSVAKGEESSESDKPEWVVLRKVKNEKGMQYKQLGPYNKDRVIELLDSGEILFSDYGWKTGLESWVPINKLEDFKAPLPSSIPIETQMYEDGDVAKAKAASKNDMTSLTELIEIEKFQRERTQVMSATQIREHWQENTKTGQQREPEPTTSDPSQLWSLEPPPEGENIKMGTSLLEPEGFQPSSVLVESEAVTPFKSRKSSKFRERNFSQVNRLSWAAAAGAFVLSLGFLYFSFFGSQGEVENQGVSEQATLDKVKGSPSQARRRVIEPEPKKDDSTTKIEKLQARLKELRSRVPEFEKKKKEK